MRLELPLLCICSTAQAERQQVQDSFKFRQALMMAPPGRRQRTLASGELLAVTSDFHSIDRCSFAARWPAARFGLERSEDFLLKKGIHSAPQPNVALSARRIYFSARLSAAAAAAAEPIRSQASGSGGVANLSRSQVKQNRTKSRPIH